MNENVGTFIQSICIDEGQGHIVEMANPEFCQSWRWSKKEKKGDG
jgi:hypothetical protein